MKKQDLIKLAVLGMTAGGFISAACGGSAATRNNVRVNRAPSAAVQHSCNGQAQVNGQPRVVPDNGNFHPSQVQQQSTGGCHGQQAPTVGAPAPAPVGGQGGHHCGTPVASGCGSSSCSSYSAGNPNAPGNQAQMSSKRSNRR